MQDFVMPCRRFIKHRLELAPVCRGNASISLYLDQQVGPVIVRLRRPVPLYAHGFIAVVAGEILLCVLNGSIMFTAELMKRLEFNLELVSIKLTSYSGTSSTGKVRQAMGLTSDISGRRVIIVEDIVDTGNTIVALKELLREKGAKETVVCTMLLKPEVYSKDVPLEYVAIELPNRFIVGFGLDYDEIGRNLKDIYVLDED